MTPIHVTEAPTESASPLEAASDPKALLDILRRRKRTFVAVFAATLAVGLLTTALSKPIYQAEAKLLVRPGSSNVSLVDATNPISTLLAYAQPDTVGTQLEVLDSEQFL